MGIYTKAFLSAFKPRSILTVSEWADRNRVLTTETSSVPGNWRTDFTPYLREPMDMCADPNCKHIVLMFGSQLGKSEGLNNVIGYYIDQEPAPQMMVQPTEKVAKDYSQIRISPMIKASPALASKVIEEENAAKSKKDKPSMFYKPYNGGYLVLAGSNSAPGLASKPIRILLRDEIDRFTDSIPGEGSPLELSEQRTRTFYNRKIVDSSTPLEEGTSKIEAIYNKSDKRNYYVPCPHCDEYQTLDFKNVKWQKEGTDQERSKTAHIECASCGEKIKGSGRADSDWLMRGKWIKTAESDIAGFYLNALYSPLITLEEIVLKYLEAIHSKDEDKKQTFYNLMLGLPYKKNNQSSSEYEDLHRLRRESYEGEIPDKVCLLTAGVDVQDDRLEAEIVGWGVGWESFGIQYRVFMGKPDEPKVWRELDEWLLKRRHFAGGGEIPVSVAFVDSGGHYTTEVYAWTKPRQSRRIFSIKGHSREHSPYISKPSEVGRIKATLFNIYVDAGKSKMWSRIHEEEVGPGYCHWSRDESAGYDLEYFKRLLSEKYVVETVNGKSKGSWKKIRERNEAWDVRNYAQAAAELVIKDLSDLERLDERVDRGTGEVVQKLAPPPKKRRGTLSKGVGF